MAGIKGAHFFLGAIPASFPDVALTPTIKPVVGLFGLCLGLFLFETINAGECHRVVVQQQLAEAVLDLITRARKAKSLYGSRCAIAIL